MTPSGSTTLTPSFPLTFCSAKPTDGARLWRLVQAAGKLELNSQYFYLLLATDFGDTCLIAEHDGEAVGLVIGYHPPRAPGTAFVWQVGVLPEHQGKGIGLRLLKAWLKLPANAHCRWVTATVAEDNAASQALFHRLALDLQTRCEVRPHFTSDLFAQHHPAEPLFRIGPLAR
ncbi:MAG: diaminobutyrate acetyltransferase [Hydrogenophaga sp.]